MKGDSLRKGSFCYGKSDMINFIQIVNLDVDSSHCLHTEKYLFNHSFIRNVTLFLFLAIAALNTQMI